MGYPRGYDEESYKKLGAGKKMTLGCRQMINTNFLLWYPWHSFHWTLMFVFGHVLFWVYGFEAIDTYGYTDNNQYDEGPTGLGTGGIGSGPSGSGVFIVSLMLMVTVTGIYVKHAVTDFKEFGGSVFRDTEYLAIEEMAGM